MSNFKVTDSSFKRISEHLNTSSSEAKLIKCVELLMVYIYLPAVFSSTLPMSGLTLEKKLTKYVYVLILFFTPCMSFGSQQ